MSRAVSNWKSRTRLFGIAALVAIGISEAAFIVLWVRFGEGLWHGDLFSFWSFGRAVTSDMSVYDAAAMRIFQSHLHQGLPDVHPDLYPPSFLLLLVPLSMLPLKQAYVVWLASTAAVYVVATVDRQWRSPAAILLILAPTTLITAIFGQNGLLSAALLVGGLRNLEARPVLAGILFGLLTYKPQLGLLVPIALLASREWCVIGVACLTVGLMVLATASAFGWDIWPEWVGSLRNASGTDFSPVWHQMVTIPSALRRVDAPQALVLAVQGVIYTTAAVFVWRLFARGNVERGTVAVLLGTLLVTPYAFVYDLPMVPAALMLDWKLRRDLITALVGTAVCVTPLSFFNVPLLNLPFVAPALLGLIFLRVSTEHGGQPVEMLAPID